MNWTESNLLEGAHVLGKAVCEFRSVPGAAREPGSPAWEHLMWAVGDFERRYRDIVGDPGGDVTRYHGVKLDDGTIVLQGERGVILAELVARAISIEETDILVVEIPGQIPEEGKQHIAAQIRALLGSVHEGRPVIVLGNGARWHSLQVADIRKARADEEKIAAVSQEKLPASPCTALSATRAAS